MRRDLPPLSALRAFEAAARYRSFSRAALELNVTPSAVSHQMRHLENWLGINLFHRKTRPLTLTRSGLAYFEQVSASFDGLSAATRLFVDGPASSVVTVETMESFASDWLVPRLSGFKHRYPQLDVRISTGNDIVDFARESVDVAIRYGNGDWPDLDVQPLFDDFVFPVCSPALLSGDRPLGEPRDLVHHTLIHNTAARVGWGEWLRAADLSGTVDSSHGVFFTKSYLAARAAINGDGVALASGPLVQDALASGDLVKPFDLFVSGGGRYFVLTLPGSMQTPASALFKDWLLDERGKKNGILFEQENVG